VVGREDGRYKPRSCIAAIFHGGVMIPVSDPVLSQETGGVRGSMSVNDRLADRVGASVPMVFRTFQKKHGFVNLVRHGYIGNSK